MKRLLTYLFLFLTAVSTCLGQGKKAIKTEAPGSYQDRAFLQDYSVKYFLESPEITLGKALMDRNGKTQVLTDKGLSQLQAGRFLYPGEIVADQSYRFMNDKSLVDVILSDEQFVYLDKEVVFSNAWAGHLHQKHELPGAKLLAGNDQGGFLVTDGKRIHFLQSGSIAWRGSMEQGEIIQVIPGITDTNTFYLLTKQAVYQFSGREKSLEKLHQGTDLTAFDLDPKNHTLVIGSKKGYQVYDLTKQQAQGALQEKLPWNEITAVKIIDEKRWFGTSQGAFAVNKNGSIDYYASARWLPDDQVLGISPGKDSSVLVLTRSGLSEICFKAMTLYEKALFYEQQVRSRHIRYGFNADISGMEQGNLSTGYLKDSDNDGLWTSLYLASQAFRYATTQEPEALQNCRESLEAMERLYTIHAIPGFPARSFERNGHIASLSDPERWQESPEQEWAWKATTSSDEAIGHIFAFGVLAEVVMDDDLRKRAITLIDTLMGHILENDLYLVDYDGKPTQWGKWNPDYVNSFPSNIGDRKLNSSNIIAMLQTAYHFTKKEKYKNKAVELMQEYGYLENLMRPMGEIGQAGKGEDDFSKLVSSAWNHSDDEMYFVGYWGLYKYALSDSLKKKFLESILDHWEFERPEKEGAWNIFTAITGTQEIDLQEAVWYLKEYPLDLIKWTVKNSHRMDIEPLAPNFRNQTIKEVLPPDELKISRHNANRFILDGGRNGQEESSAGDTWLFPYWMARYLNLISAAKGDDGMDKMFKGNGNIL